MREVKEIIQRLPFEDYDIFQTPPSTIKEFSSYENTSDKEIMTKDNQLVVRSGNVLQTLKIENNEIKLKEM